MERTTGELHLGAAEGGLYVHVGGRANYTVCPTGRHLVTEFLAASSEANRVVLDLDGCQSIDSTFAGWLLGVRMQLEPRGGRLVLSRCNERCRSALDKLGLTQLFRLEDAPPPAATRPVACFGGDKADRQTLELMIQAHEQLAAVSPSNAEVFRTVVEMLKRQVQRLGG